MSGKEKDVMHTMDDDVTYERMKDNSKKTLYSTHRKLSWQFDRDVKQFEKDRNLTTYGLAREKTSMEERLVKLKEAQKQIQSRRQSEPDARRGRRSSEPCIPITDLKQLHLSGTDGEAENQNRQSKPSNKRLHARRNTVAEGMGETGPVPLLRRLTAPSFGSVVPVVKRKSSMEERRRVIPEESA